MTLGHALEGSGGMYAKRGNLNLHLSEKLG